MDNLVQAPNRHSGQNRKRHSKTESIYKNIHLPFGKFVASLISSSERFIVTILGVFSICLVFGLLSSFRITSLAIVIIIMIIGYRIRNVFMGALITLFFTLPFVIPNKFYFVTVIPGYQLLLSGLKNGFISGYGVLPSTIAITFCLVFAVRDLWKRRHSLPNRVHSVFTVINIAFIGFGLIALPTDFYRSVFPALSITWTIQYMQCYLIAILLLHAWIQHRKYFHLVYTALLSSVVLEFGVSIWQFIHQAGTGLPIETVMGTSFSRGLDENNAIFRVSGTFLYHNQLALVSLVYATMLLLALLETRRIVYLVGILLCAIMILLTQSRSAWIISLLLLVWVIKSNKKELLSLVHFIPVKRAVLYGIILAISFSYIYIPRILLSVNLPYQGAGIPIRQKMLREALDAIVLSPWFGYGAGTNEYVLHKLSPLGYTSVFPAAVHLAYLQFILEFGLLGLGAFILPFFLVLRIHINAHQKKHIFMNTFLYGSLAYAIYYLFQPHVGFIEFPFLGIILGCGLIGVYTITNK